MKKDKRFKMVKITSPGFEGRHNLIYDNTWAVAMITKEMSPVVKQMVNVWNNHLYATEFENNQW